MIQIINAYYILFLYLIFSALQNFQTFFIQSVSFFAFITSSLAFLFLSFPPLTNKEKTCDCGGPTCELVNL
jgi:hypothetical protein